MPVARARSRLVKLILPIASTIGRASKLVMSICSTGLASSSALRVSLTLGWSVPTAVSVSMVMSLLHTHCSPAKAGVQASFSLLSLGLRRGRILLPLHGSRTLALVHGSVERRHRLVVDDLDAVDAEAVEAGAHRAAVGAEHADLDVIAGRDVARKLERAGHAVEVVAGRSVEAELHRPNPRGGLAQQPHRIAPADVRGIEQRSVSAVVDVQLRAAALFDAHHQARIFGAQSTAGLAPQFGRVADRQRFEG